MWTFEKNFTRSKNCALQLCCPVICSAFPGQWQLRAFQDRMDLILHAERMRKKYKAAWSSSLETCAWELSEAGNAGATKRNLTEEDSSPCWLGIWAVGINPAGHEMKRKQAKRGAVSVSWRAPSGLDHHWEGEIVKRNGYVGRKGDQGTDVTEVSHLFRQTVIFFPL